MPSNCNQDIKELLLEAYRKGVEQAIDLSARTGVPLMIEENGMIKQIKPKYKYVRVPTLPKETDSKPPKKLRK